MGILSDLEPLFTNAKLPDIFNHKKCSTCAKNNAAWVCGQCGLEEEDVYYCDKHIERVPEHVTVDDNGKQKTHRFKRISENMSSEELKDEFKTRLEPVVVDLKAQLSAEKVHIEHAIKEAKRQADYEIMKLCDQFYAEIDLLREKVYVDIDNQAIQKLGRIDEMDRKASEVRKQYYEYRDFFKANNDFDRPKDMSPDQIKNLQVDIQATMKEIDDYIPILGPFLEFQRVDMKKVTHMMVTHRVGMKQVDIVRSADLRWRPITPSMSHIYSAERHLPQWCLHDLPLVVVPHPDYDISGPSAKEQIRLLSTMAVECEKVQRVVELGDLSNNIGLMRCDDKIVRRISVRYLHDKFFIPDEPKHDFVLEMEGGHLLDSDFDKAHFMHEVEENIGKQEQILTCRHKKGNRSEICMEFRDLKSMKKGKKYIEDKYSDIKVRRRSNCIIVFIDEIHLEPIVVGDDLTQANGKKLEIYHPDPEMNFLKYPQMAVEVWLDLGHPLDVRQNYEPFRKTFVQNEVGWGLRSFLRDGKEFKVEFLKQMHKDMPWAWIGSITCNNENLKDKAQGIDKSRQHFPIPKLNKEI